MTDTNNIEVLRSALVRIAMGESDAQKIADDAIATTRALSARASAGEGGEYVLVPRRLTAENGAKGLLSGEFAESVMIDCPECESGTIEGAEHCEVCSGEGRYRQQVPVEWTTIKEIHRMVVENLATPAPQPAQAGASGGGMCDCIASRCLHEKTCASLTTPASSATGQVAAGCAHVWVPGQAGMMYCDQCGRQKPAATPQPAAAQEDARATFKSHFPQFDLTEKSDAWGRPQFIHEHVESIFYGWKERASLITAPQPQPTINSSEIDSKLTDARPATPPAHGDGEGDISGIARIFIAEHDKAKADCIPKIFAKGQRKERDVIVALRAVMEQLRPLVNADIAYSGDGLLAVVEENHPHQIICYWPVKAAEVLTTRPTPEAQEARDAARFIVLRDALLGTNTAAMEYFKSNGAPTSVEQFNAYCDAALALPAQSDDQ